MVKSIVLAIVSALFLASARLASASTILVFGDSISAGYGMRVEEGWVALLQEKLKAQEYGWRVVNASVSGETTDGGRARLPRALQLHRPKIVILELGANDGLRGLPVERVRANLESMIADAQAAGAEVLLLGMPLPANYGAAYLDRFGAAFADLARQYRLQLVPFALEDAVDAKLLQEDGLHPSVQAQPRILATIWPALSKTLQKMSREQQWKKSG